MPANHFPAPGVGDGLMLAASADRVVAFPASSGPATTSPGTPPASTASHQPAPSASRAIAGAAGGLPAGAIAGIVVGALVVIGAIGWLFRRSRTAGRS